jgi:hypothetical protein
LRTNVSRNALLWSTIIGSRRAFYRRYCYSRSASCALRYWRLDEAAGTKLLTRTDVRMRTHVSRRPIRKEITRTDVCMRTHLSPRSIRRELTRRRVAMWVQVRASTTNSIRNLQNIKYRHDDQPAQKRAEPYRIHMLQLLNRHSSKKLMLKNVCICKMFVQCCAAHYVIKLLILWSWQRRFLRLCIHNICTHNLQNLRFPQQCSWGFMFRCVQEGSPWP